MIAFNLLQSLGSTMLNLVKFSKLLNLIYWLYWVIGMN